MVIVAAAFTAQFLIYGNIKALGVLVNAVSDHFDTEIWLTGWVVSISFAVQHLSGERSDSYVTFVSVLLVFQN